MISRFVALALLVAPGIEPPPPGTDPGRPPLTYAATIAPIFRRHCVPCHGPDQSHGGLRLDSYEAALRGGESGIAINPGDAENSLLIQKIEHRDRPVMPPQKKLPRATIATLRAWIDRGAPRDTGGGP